MPFLWLVSFHRGAASVPVAAAYLILVRSVKALAEYVGGMRWGSTSWLASYATWPLAELVICDDRLILTAPHGGYELPRDKIARLTKRRAIFSGGIRIEHTVQDYPSYLFFSTFAFRDMYDSLIGAGFPLKT
jgi:hypothetical protein